jgi:hypothetical protein
MKLAELRAGYVAKLRTIAADECIHDADDVAVVEWAILEMEALQILAVTFLRLLIADRSTYLPPKWMANRLEILEGDIGLERLSELMVENEDLQEFYELAVERLEK